MKKKILFMLLPALMAISAGTALPTAVFASEGNSKNTKALAPVDETLYWGYSKDAKIFYLSKTDRAISEEGVTANSFDSTIEYLYSTLPWYHPDVHVWDIVDPSNLTTIKILNDITPGQTTSWFSGMFNVTEIDGIEKLNTSNVTNMNSMFELCSALENIDVSHFDTSIVTDMGGMFDSCEGLKSLDLSNFDTSNVTLMAPMFYDCHALESLDVSSFNTSKVTSMGEMFSGCYALESLDVSSFDTSNVLAFAKMFYDCRALKSLDLSNFQLSGVTKEASEGLGLGYMFAGCAALTELDLSSFDTSNITTMKCMFDTCRALRSVNLSSFDTSNVTDMFDMFKNCTSLTTLDLSSFDCSNVEAGDLFRLTPPIASNKYTLVSLKTPKNLKVDMKVPGINSSLNWYNADTLDAYDNAYLPKDSTNSVTLAAGVLVDSWSSLQDAITASSGTPTEPADKISPIILKNDLVAPAEGGASIKVYNGKNVSINLNGNVLNANGCSFSAVNVIIGGKLTIIDTKPTAEHYFTVGDNGLWTLTNTKTDTTKTVLGGVITGANFSNNNGGGVKNDGTFNMDGGNICGNNAGNGGGVYNHGVFNMSANSAILGNTANMGGGVSFTGTFNMSENSQISNNTAISYGGGVYTASDTAQFIMSDNSKITDNIAKKAGGGLYLSNGGFTMNGGEITGNNANGYSGLLGGGVFSNSSSVVLGGKAKISGNTAGADDSKIANNFELYAGKYITLGTKTASDEGNGVKAPTGDFKVGVTMKSAGKFTTNGTEDDTKYFSSDNEYYEVKYNADEYLELTPIPLPSPVMSPTSGYATSVTLTAEEGTIYYTTNGSEPTASSTKYMGSPIPVTSDNFVIKAIAIDTVNSRKSEVVTGIFTNVIKCTVNINAVNGTVDVEELTNIVFDTAYSINANRITIGDTEITATADEGFEFNCWKIGDTPAAASGSIRSNLTFTAVFSDHDLVKINGTPATEDHDGLKDAYKCNLCNQYFEDEAGIKLIGDEAAYNAWKLDGGKINKLDHDMVLVSGAPVTEGADGFKDAYKCNNCGKYFEDEAGTKLIGDEAAYNAWKLAEGKIPALDPQKENGLSGGAIAGIVIGSVFGLLIIAFAVLYILWKRKNLNVPLLCIALTPAFRFINKLFFKTKLNDVEAKEAENKAAKE